MNNVLPTVFLLPTNGRAILKFGAMRENRKERKLTKSCTDSRDLIQPCDAGIALKQALLAGFPKANPVWCLSGLYASYYSLFAPGLDERQMPSVSVSS